MWSSEPATGLLRARHAAGARRGKRRGFELGRTHALPYGSSRLGCMSLLYATLRVLPRGPTPCNGSGRAGKRQSQSLLKPKLEFRGPKLARFPAFFDQKRPKLGVAP